MAIVHKLAHEEGKVIARAFARGDGRSFCAAHVMVTPPSRYAFRQDCTREARHTGPHVAHHAGDYASAIWETPRAEWHGPRLEPIYLYKLIAQRLVQALAAARAERSK